MLYQCLTEVDPEVDAIIKKEEDRQRSSIELIASENFPAMSVLQVGSSVLANKYSEGEVGTRYYGGTENIDELETLCKKRALELFNLSTDVWDVNVQVLSGSNANLAVYLGLLGKDGKLMGLNLPSGGHLTHGFKTPKKKISASSIFFESCQYSTKPDGTIDYDDLEKKAGEFKPGLIVCGASAYPLDFDYERLRKIAGDAYLMTDMAHISGFVATGLMKNCFEHSDVVTTTTHKLLRGPRAAMIFFKKTKVIGDRIIDVKTAINSAVFPGLNGGPHNQKIGALAVTLKQANSQDYKDYCNQVLKNAQCMVNEFIKKGYTIACEKTECHLFLLSCIGLTGSEMEKVLEFVSISLNKNCIATDKSPLNPSAVRIGTPAMTTRGFKEAECLKTVNFIDAVFKETIELKVQVSEKKSFTEIIASSARLRELKKEINEFARSFPLPFFEFRQKK